VAGRCVLQTTRGPARGLPPNSTRVVAQMKRHTAWRHSSAQSKGDTPISATGFSRLPVGSRGPCVGRIVETTSDRPGLAGSSPGTVGRRNPGASGSVNRWLRPDSVRHMSVTTAMQGLTAAHHETQRDKMKKARETGKIQLTGYFRRWWQVLGSNQRRLSRRFYRPLPLAARATCHMPSRRTGTVKDSGHGGRPPHASHAQTAAITAIRARSNPPMQPPAARLRPARHRLRPARHRPRPGTDRDDGAHQRSRRGAEAQYLHDRSRASTQPAARQRRRSTTPA
jgi:hypothetical protein